MSDFLKKYLKICGIGLGILILAAAVILAVNIYNRPDETIVMNEVTETAALAEPTVEVPSVVMTESRRLKETVQISQPSPSLLPSPSLTPTLQPTQDIIFNENSYISPTPATEPTHPPVRVTPQPTVTLPPAEPTPEIKSEKYICTISIVCTDILPVDDENPKSSIVPADGIILKKTTAGFTEGETVADVLLRTLKENKIHFDYESKSATGGGYIRAIGNIYQFDFGGKSGWVYTVNGENVSVGASAYKLSDGDIVEWKYVK